MVYVLYCSKCKYTFFFAVAPLFHTFVRSLSLYRKRNMERFRYIIVALCIMFVLQGCDMFRGMLGMPTSEDIELMNEELQAKQQEILQQQRAAFVEDSLRKVQEQADVKPEIGGYHVIVGSFKDYRNAEALAEFVKKQGYNPVQIPLKNGYMMVSLGQMETLPEAVRMMNDIEQKEECPYDVWIYSARQNLHTQN